MTTNTSSADCQVLVVGAGPTGLTLAAQLLARGVQTRVIDKGVGPATQSRALGVHARTLEVLDTMGLADAFIARGHRVRYVHMHVAARRLFDLDLANNGSRYGFTLSLPQRDTELLLRTRVQELGGVIEQGVELLHLTQTADGVDATLSDAAGHQTEMTAGYVVGCDGAHSRVRHQLDLPFLGQPYPQDWLLADVALAGPIDPTAVSMYFRPNGLPVTFIPMGKSRCRIVMANAGDRHGPAPTLDEIQDLTEQRAPWPVVVSDPVWLASFRCQLRSVTTYRRGRVFLAGDAAHIQAPAGGQGMNTGMTDAHNLAWKLALVLDERAPDGMLDSYQQERLPVASGVLAFGDNMVKLMTMRSPWQRALRATVLPLLSSLPAVQRRAAGQLSQVSVTYPPGQLVLPDDERGAPRPGQRVSDLTLRTANGPEPLSQLLRQGRHLLVTRTPDAHPLGSLGVTSDGAVEIVAGRVGDSVEALIRPDGVLAAREATRTTDYLQRLLGGGLPLPQPARTDVSGTPGVHPDGVRMTPVGDV
jgi:2-polyprenyl-6-methoxyphenol hydroxylase-like FAD-dependent oxidoreductase